MLGKLLTPLLMLLLLCSNAHAQATCTIGCMCASNRVECSGIDVLPPVFPENTTHFIFSDCPFPPELGPMPAEYKNAKQISFHRCQIHSLHLDAFDFTPELEQLSLLGNKLELFDSHPIKKLAKLKSLDLQANKIKEIGNSTFKYNPMLETLILNNNHHLNLSKQAFKNASSLRHIHMEHCNQTTIDGPTFCGHSKVPNLELLDMSGNDFRNFREHAFKHMSKLKQLELDSCKMVEIKRETFAKMTKLEILNLGHNDLYFIDEQAFDDIYPTLVTLDLQHNNLTKAPHDMFNWGTLLSLNVSYNPWDCSCANSWMQEYPWSPNSTVAIRCTFPEEHKGHNAITVMKEMDYCEPPDSGPNAMIAVYVAIPILAVLTIITIIIIVKICKLKKKEARGRSAQYSLVYKPTTEKA